ncbi:MAG: histidine kinase dimerization/phospho-acceptor domain-containing protein [Pseudomonadota bacterium]
MNRIAVPQRESALRRYADAYRTRIALDAATARAVEAERHALVAEDQRQAFLSGLNHELRTPLNHILGFGELLQQADAYSLPVEKRAEYLELILKAATALLDQINLILKDAGYGETSSGVDDEPSLVLILRRLLQQHAETLFVGKIDLADDLPGTDISAVQLSGILQSVFSLLGQTSGDRRPLGIRADSAPDEDQVVLTLTVLSADDPLPRDGLEISRARLTELGGSLDHQWSDAGEHITITLPAQRKEIAA